MNFRGKNNSMLGVVVDEKGNTAISVTEGVVKTNVSLTFANAVAMVEYLVPHLQAVEEMNEESDTKSQETGSGDATETTPGDSTVADDRGTIGTAPEVKPTGEGTEELNTEGETEGSSGEDTEPTQTADATEQSTVSNEQGQN